MSPPPAAQILVPEEHPILCQMLAAMSTSQSKTQTPRSSFDSYRQPSFGGGVNEETSLHGRLNRADESRSVGC